MANPVEWLFAKPPRRNVVKPQVIGRVRTDWLESHNHRDMQLVEDFSYYDRFGWHWIAPAGSIINGANIPWFFRRLIGCPFVGPWRRPSVIHDVYCQEEIRPWPDVHRVFREMCIMDGVWKPKAWVMWAGVRWFGPGSLFSRVYKGAARIMKSTKRSA